MNASGSALADLNQVGLSTGHEGVEDAVIPLSYVLLAALTLILLLVLVNLALLLWVMCRRRVSPRENIELSEFPPSTE